MTPRRRIPSQRGDIPKVDRPDGKQFPDDRKTVRENSLPTEIHLKGRIPWKETRKGYKPQPGLPDKPSKACRGSRNGEEILRGERRESDEEQSLSLPLSLLKGPQY
jgi:hypothetical protein